MLSASVLYLQRMDFCPTTSELGWELSFQMNPQLPAWVLSRQTLSRGPSEAMLRLLTPRNHAIINGCCFKPLNFVVTCYTAIEYENGKYGPTLQKESVANRAYRALFSAVHENSNQATHIRTHICLFPRQLGPESVASRSLSTHCNLPGFTWCTGVWMAGGKMLALSTKWAQLEASGSPTLPHPPLCLENRSSHSLFKECC